MNNMDGVSEVIYEWGNTYCSYLVLNYENTLCSKIKPDMVYHSHYSKIVIKKTKIMSTDQCGCGSLHIVSLPDTAKHIGPSDMARILLGI